MKVINNCSDCSVRTFISAKFDNNLNGLIVSGKPDKEQLLQSLDGIETEFNDLCGVFPDELKQVNKINALIARNKAVELYFFAIDECLRRAGIPCLDALTGLKRNGISIKWNDDIVEYEKQIQSAKTRNISKEVELEELKSQLETIQSKSVKSAQFTKKNFYQLILSVETVLGTKVPEIDTNMFKFGVMCADFYNLTKKQTGS